MMNKPFIFKEFKINQNRCAMKIGTDAVLLGAWTSIENNPFSVPDRPKRGIRDTSFYASDIPPADVRERTPRGLFLEPRPLRRKRRKILRRR